MTIIEFQKIYALKNRDMAVLCACSLPTIQKWRSGEIGITGTARCLMELLDELAGGDPLRMQDYLNKRKAPDRDRGLDPLVTGASDLLTRQSNPAQLDLMLANRRLERALFETEARYLAVMDACKDPICRWLEDTTLTYVNAAYRHLFQRGSEELVGRRWIEFVPMDDRAELLALVANAARSGETVRKQHTSLDRDGRTLYHDWLDLPIRSSNGEVIEFHSIGRDRTLEVELRNETRYLLAATNLLMEYTSSPLVLMDEKCRFLEVNAAFRAAHGEQSEVGSLEHFAGKRDLGRLAKLLSQMTLGERLLYRLGMDACVVVLTVNLLFRNSGHSRYLAAIGQESLPELNQVLKLRLESEAFVAARVATDLQDPIECERRRWLRENFRRLGESMQVHRVTLFWLKPESDIANVELEWCADSIEPLADHLQGLPMSEYAWWMRKILRGHKVKIDDVRKLPAHASAEQRLLTAQDVRALLAVPVIDNDRIRGFLAVDHLHQPRFWHDQDEALMTACRDEIIAAFSNG